MVEDRSSVFLIIMRFFISLVKLLLLVSIALIIDLFIYALTKTCASCTTFSDFIASPHSLFAPTWASLGLLAKKLKIKG